MTRAGDPRVRARRADGMVLRRNGTAHRAWGAAGYVPGEHWRRRVEPLPGNAPDGRF
ncbi:hypothetical protein ACFU5P_08060 [Streptomyces sp. NPDC057433]|uniref:hypothetical protein n=1 Tax=Streptomyces sp. NPDC057433 TaxID=3346132 RepID=UPI0036975A45